MTHFYLFLDETNPNANLPAFCLAGCVVEEERYNRELIPMVNNLKLHVFGTTDVILHEAEIRSNSKKGLLRVLYDPEKWEQFWKGMDTIWSVPGLLTCLGVVVRINDYERFYPSKFRSDPYLVAVQIITENFAHFLERHDGYGTVYLESRDPAADERIQNRFHSIKATGTLFMRQTALQNRLGTVSFPLKTDNNIGLQMADFIPNPCAREAVGKGQKIPSLYERILAARYDGGLGMPERFGIKVLP